MARKPRETQPKAEVVADDELPKLPEAVAAANVLAVQGQQVIEQYGDGLPYDRERVVTECRFFMAATAETMLETGRRLILLKENEAHGDFIDIVEGRLGMTARTAQRIMAASVKFTSPKLTPKATTLSFLGKAKLFELVAEDDDELAALAEGGTVAGLKLEDVDRMSVRELRAALREAREDAEAKNKLIADKNEKIDTLDAKLSAAKKRVKATPPDEEGEELRKEAGIAAFAVEADITGRLRPCFQALIDHASAHGANHDEVMAGMVCQIDRALAGLREEFGITARPEGYVVPEWAQNYQQEAAE